MKLVVVSGRSGSGKSTALNVLEDLSYYCIDNLPVGLLPPLVSSMLEQQKSEHQNVAISIDARNLIQDLERFPEIMSEVEKLPIKCEILYLDADEITLLQRFSATRRKHPLSSSHVALPEAIKLEKQRLDPITQKADLIIDTTNLTMYQLRDLVKQRVADKVGYEMAILFESFGFKRGVPVDADVVFDVRCLPNPYWEPAIREYNGTEPQIIDFLSQQPLVNEMFKDICVYLDKWLPQFRVNNRSYMTVAIGCTGGQHRSVYLSERLSKHYQGVFDNVQVRHRELSH